MVTKQIKQKYITFYADSVIGISRCIKESLENGYVPIFKFQTASEFKNKTQVDYHIISELRV